MRCSDARAWMSAYFDSELDAGTTFKIARHLECCEACCERFCSESSADASIAGELRREEMPDGLWSELRSSVAGHRRRVHRAWMVVVAVILAGGLLAVLTEERTASEPDRSTQPLRLSDGEALEVEGVFRDFMRTARSDGSWAAEEGAPWIEVGGVGAGTLLPLLEGSSLDLAEAGAGHATHLVSIRRRQLEGREVMDLRLECCGEPILLRVTHAPDDDRNPVAGGGITRPAVGRPAVTDPGIAGADDAQRVVKVAERRFGEWVAIGASCHSIDHVLLALRPT